MKKNLENLMKKIWKIKKNMEKFWKKINIYRNLRKKL